MRRKRLTEKFIKAAKPGKHHDGDGLFLRVSEAGGRYWVHRVTQGGKRVEIGLGNADLMSLTEARELVHEHRKRLRGGENLLAERQRERTVPTFREAAARVAELHKPTWRSEKHANDFANSLTMYAHGKIGDRRVSDLTVADVMAVLTPIWLERAETARRVKQRMSTIFKWSMAQGWRTDDPSDAVTKALPAQSKAKEHFKALPYPEVAGCIDAVRNSRAWIGTKLALEFTVLTAARSGEVRGAMWSEIDLEQATWTVPGERMKMKKPHRVPLSTRALDVLAEAQAIRDKTGLVFPSSTGKTLSDMTMSKLVKEQGFDVHVHGFRSSFRQWAQEQTNIPAEVAEQALAHSAGDEVVRAYARSDLFEKRQKMMQAWCDYLAVRRGEVVPIRRA
jgi:integrase